MASFIHIRLFFFFFPEWTKMGLHGYHFHFQSHTLMGKIFSGNYQYYLFFLIYEVSGQNRLNKWIFFVTIKNIQIAVSIDSYSTPRSFSLCRSDVTFFRNYLSPRPAIFPDQPLVSLTNCMAYVHALSLPCNLLLKFLPLILLNFLYDF